VVRLRNCNISHATSGVKKQELFLSVILFIVALIPRLIFILLYPSGFPSVSDGANYQELANAILKGKANYVFFVAPLYPYFIAACYKLFGYYYLAVKIPQVIFSALTAVVSWKYGKLAHGTSLAFVFYALVAFNPELIFYSGIYMTECLYIFLLILFIYFSACYLEENKTRSGIMAGVLFALILLYRKIPLLFPIFILLAKPTKRTLEYIGIIFLCWALIVMPWVVRNYLVSGKKFIGISAQGGRDLWSYNNTLLYGEVEKAEHLKALRFRDVKKIWDQYGIPTGNDHELNKFLNFILEHPKKFAVLCLIRFKQYWGDPFYSHDLFSAWFGKLANAYYRILLLFSVTGIIILIIQRRIMSSLNLLPILFITYDTFINTISISDHSRYRVPIYIFLSYFASYAMIEAVKWVGSLPKYKIKILNSKEVPD